MSCRAANDSGWPSPAPWRWDPEVLVADEPVSMLDVSLRSGILRVMLDLRDRRGIAILFITHDLSLAWLIADRIAVMYLGRVMEIGPAEQLVRDPRHPYTRALLSVMPSPDPAHRRQRQILRGETPDASRIPPGVASTPDARSPSIAAGWRTRPRSRWRRVTSRRASLPATPPGSGLSTLGETPRRDICRGADTSDDQCAGVRNRATMDGVGRPSVESKNDMRCRTMRVARPIVGLATILALLPASVLAGRPSPAAPAPSGSLVTGAAGLSPGRTSVDTGQLHR